MAWIKVMDGHVEKVSALQLLPVGWGCFPFPIPEGAIGMSRGTGSDPRGSVSWYPLESRAIEILEFLAARRQNASLPHCHKDGEVAGILAGALRNRQDNV